MSDPVFTTRAELVAWAEKELRDLRYTFLGMTDLLEGIEAIKRVTLAHAHLEDVEHDEG